MLKENSGTKQCHIVHIHQMYDTFIKLMQLLLKRIVNLLCYNTYIIKQDLHAFTTTIDGFIYVQRKCFLQLEDQCSDTDKRYYSMNKIDLHLVKRI